MSPSFTETSSSIGPIKLWLHCFSFTLHFLLEVENFVNFKEEDVVKGVNTFSVSISRRPTQQPARGTGHPEGHRL